MRNTILVIEDHESLRLLMTNFLKKDYEVVAKSDGLEGLAWLSKGNIPAVILLDLSLPNLNGLEFLTNIRCSGFFSAIPVIVVSGEDTTPLRAVCEEQGISGFLTKPFNPLELQTKIRIAISKQQAQQA